MRSTSNGTRPTSCFNCVPVWLEQPVRFCGTLENSRRWAESAPCSKLVSTAKTKMNVSVPNCDVVSDQKVNRCKNSIKMSII